GRVAGGGAEVAEVARGPGGEVVVVARGRLGAGPRRPPRGVVAPGELGRRALLVGVVADRDDRPRLAGEERRRRLVPARPARGDVAGGEEDAAGGCLGRAGGG